MFKVFTLLLICFGSVIATEAQDWLIVKLKGDVELRGHEQPDKTKLGQKVKLGDELRVGAPGFAVLAHPSKVKIVVPSMSQVRWHGQPSPLIALQRGALKVLGDETGSSTTISVPHGKVLSASALWSLFLRPDESAILDLERGAITIEHRSGSSEHDAPKRLKIDRHGVREYRDGSLPRPRVIFDFDDHPELLAQALEEKTQRENEEKAAANNDNTNDVMRGRASNAKIVEGQGSGEGEYSWDFSVNPYLLIIPILGAAVFFFVKKRYQKHHDQQNKKGAGAREHGYESEDVQVWRGALTAHDPPLLTNKKTIVTGDVEDGATIQAKHELIVKGSFQGASLSSSKDVTIVGGVNGQGKAHLEIQGQLNVAYISEATVLSLRGVTVDKAIRNATVLSQAAIVVKGKNILGGQVASHESIQTQAIGSDFCETKVHLGKSLSEQCRLFELDCPPWAPKSEDNTSAFLRVDDEWVSAQVEQGLAKLNQKKNIPGPVETKLDPTDSSKIQIRGCARTESSP